MDHGKGNSPQIGSIRKYLGKSLKFYSLSAESLPPAVFVFILALGTISIFLPDKLLNDNWFYIIYNFINIILVFMASSVYLYACISEFSGKKYTVRDCMTRVLHTLPVLTAAYILVTVADIVGLALFIIPGLVLYIMLMFFSCFILDAGSGVIQSIRESRRITTGRKMELFSIMLLLNLILIVPLVIIIIVAVPQNDMRIMTFVTTFFISLLGLVQQRAIALLYLDLKDKST